MRSKRVFAAIIVVATVVFAAVVFLLSQNMSDLLSSYNSTELKYVSSIEEQLMEAIRLADGRDEALTNLLDTYPMEVVVEEDGAVTYASLNLTAGQVYQHMISEKALAVESSGTVLVDGNEVYVWYGIYHMSTVEYVEAYLSSQNLLIVIAFIVLFILIMVIQYFLLGPLYRVRDSIDKLEQFEFEGVDAGEDELGKKVNAFSTKLDRTIKAVSRKNTNLELSLQLERERLNNTIQFTKALVHDLKSPLHAQLLENEFQIEKLAEPNREAKQIAEYNIERTDMVLKEINEILKVMNTDVYKFNEAPERFDLIELVHDTAKLFRTSMVKKEMSFCLEAEESSMVCLNKISVQLLFHNIISNMVQYGLHNSELELEVDITSQAVHIITRNESTPENIRRMENSQNLFNVVVEERTKEHIYSSGNGLFLIRDLINLLKGSYEYQADHNQVVMKLMIPIREGGGQ